MMRHGEHVSSSSAPKRIELPEDLCRAAQAEVDAGRYPDIGTVVREAFAALDLRRKVAELQEAIDVGVRQIEAGDYVEGTPAQIMASVRDRRSFDDTKKSL